MADADPGAVTTGHDDWDARRRRWRDVSKRALESLFTTREMADECSAAASQTTVVMYGGGPDIAQDKDDVRNGVTKLQSLLEPLHFIEPADPLTDSPASQVELPASPAADAQIFLVHGRDLKTLVARTLERAGEHPVVILHEKPGRGRTIIEKFEEHASAADYAVILATADDLGRLNPKYADDHEDPPRTSHGRARMSSSNWATS